MNFTETLEKLRKFFRFAIEAVDGDAEAVFQCFRKCLQTTSVSLLSKSA